MKTNKYTALLRQASESPRGLTIKTNDPETLRKILANIVRELGDSDLSKLTFYRHPQDSECLMILKPGEPLETLYKILED